MTQTLATRARAQHRDKRDKRDHAPRRQESSVEAITSAAPTIHIAWPASLLFASGAASLIYQVLWVKQLTLVVGAEVQAVTTGVSAFFAGLALGGWLFGRLADRMEKPLRAYAWIELSAMILAVGATFALAYSARPFAAMQDQIGALAWALPFALVGIPAMLMGGTLPVLVRSLAPLAGTIGRSGGRLYAANTAGAIAGTLAAPFILIPALGVQGSAVAAGALNAAASIVAIVLAGRVPASAHASAPVSAPMTTAEPAESRNRARLALVLYAIAGGIALGYEVIWSQAIVQFISTRSFAFSIVLATYLCGLVAGSAIVSRHADRARDPWSVFALLIVAAGLVALLEIAFLGEWLLQGQARVSSIVFGATGSALAAMCARFALAGFCIVFVPTLLLGAAFPFALRLGVDVRKVGRDVGTIIAMNTAGGIAGTLLAGFVLVPLLGLVHALAALAVAASVVGVIAVTCGSAARSKIRWSVPALALVALGAALFTPSDRLASMLAQARGGDLAFYAESEGGTVAVIAQKSAGNRFKRLYIQGVSNSGDAMTSLRYMRLQAMLPLLIHRGEPRSALVIGLGTGITGGALLPYPGLEQRVVAELLPAVVRAAPQFKGNYGMSTDPRIDIRLHDGRRELLRNTQRYDVITLEPPPPSASGVVNLYSSDFYELAASRLQDGGLVAQWLPLPTQNEDDTRALIKSFVAVFPYATLWTTELHEMMLIGSMQPIELDVPRIASRFNQPTVAAALREVGIASPAALLATWITDRAGLEYYAADIAPVTDDRPAIEYAAWVRSADFPNVLTHLLAMRADPPLKDADETFKNEVQSEYHTLQTFYDAGLNAYRGNRDAWQANIRSVMHDDADNPYYRWFVQNGS
ncbi:fused MFS/spermidine synthase [Burkholderia sp. Leaf177]|uniref:fused MFS/spermidine synthase n=1 Tax=Burkholderia sp. Leaf177 TaxID=1736287 RepID=UPI000A94D6CB|nr:fused MFS/spermidine synthase [Burkholderia sp. Leaf177]